VRPLVQTPVPPKQKKEEEDIMSINLYAPNVRVPNFIKQTLT
jgi:hypothetical protein